MENNLETVCLMSFGMRGRVEIEEENAVVDKKSYSDSLETSEQVQFRETNRAQNLTRSIWSKKAGCLLGEAESSSKNLFDSVEEPKQERV